MDSRVGISRLFELVEYLVDIFFSDTRSAIAHAVINLRKLSVSGSTNLQQYFSFIGEFDRVTYQIKKNLFKSERVAHNDAVVGNPDRQAELYIDRKSTRLNSSHVKIS